MNPEDMKISKERRYENDWNVLNKMKKSPQQADLGDIEEALKRLMNVMGEEKEKNVDADKVEHISLELITPVSPHARLVPRFLSAELYKGKMKIKLALFDKLSKTTYNKTLEESGKLGCWLSRSDHFDCADESLVAEWNVLVRSIVDAAVTRHPKRLNLMLTEMKLEHQYFLNQQDFDLFLRAKPSPYEQALEEVIAIANKTIMHKKNIHEVRIDIVHGERAELALAVLAQTGIFTINKNRIGVNCHTYRKNGDFDRAIRQWLKKQGVMILS